MHLRNQPSARLLRVHQILELIPIGKSSWWRGVADGRYPQPIKLGRNTTVWRESEILALIERGCDD